MKTSLHFTAKDYSVEKVVDDGVEMKLQLDWTIEDTNVVQFVVFRTGSKLQIYFVNYNF